MLSLSGVLEWYAYSVSQIRKEMCGGGEGVERENGRRKEDEDKALPTRQNSRGLVFVQVLQLSLSGSLSCAALSGKKKKRERKRQRAVSTSSSDFNLDDCWEMNVTRQNKESLINVTKR